MKSRASRRQPASPLTALLAVSVVVHTAILYFGFDHSPSLPFVDADKPGDKTVTARKQGAKVRSMSPTCVADVMLAAAARSAMCLTPLADKLLPCLSKVKKRTELDLLACNDETPPPSVALLDNKTPLSRLKPMPLLPLLKAAKQRAFLKKQEKALAKKLLLVKKKELIRPVKGAQIVEITKPDVQLAPKKSRFVSDYDSRVKTQTVARGSTEKMVARPGPRELKTIKKQPEHEPVPKTKPDKTALTGKANEPKIVAKVDNDPKRTKTVETKQPDKRAPGMLSMRDPRRLAKRMKMTRGITTGRNGRVTPTGIEPRKGNGRTRVAARTIDPTRRGVDSGGKAGMRRRVPNLHPSKKLLRRVVGGGSVDKVDNVKSGKITALNARRWKFASFFNRLKRQVAQNWHPDRVYGRRDPQGNVYGTKDRLTVLRVKLNKDGSVSAVIIQQASGVGFLDDEAERAFRAAGPFPNPPAALLGRTNRQIEFSFGFYFQIGSRRDSWKIFRYR